MILRDREDRRDTKTVGGIKPRGKPTRATIDTILPVRRFEPGFTLIVTYSYNLAK